VREVVQSVKQVTGVDFAVQTSDRRPGDPAQLAADNRRILATLDWRPRHDDLETIVRSAVDWERRQLNHPWRN
ncbi:MAG TPA: UDP-glucose 4-epimerase GalE, partial [Pseudomonadales bacterium]|nr:UDP-glucose 4-epimerase GalE [Pseudomonadales bacterium]